MQSVTFFAFLCFVCLVSVASLTQAQSSVKTFPVEGFDFLRVDVKNVNRLQGGFVEDITIHNNDETQKVSTLSLGMVLTKRSEVLSSWNMVELETTTSSTNVTAWYRLPLWLGGLKPSGNHTFGAIVLGDEPVAFTAKNVQLSA
eukprot:TRINITY_DN2086_c0_g4_i1.p1 TRINITY_DN2086_c0_g4~~TRINITY_DN2086_c0_g4_i1.p1  ORF type:complete len:144 (+),score=25.45 TRINITY_DN2086_c0_g4_i1:110-541(+)